MLWLDLLQFDLRHAFRSLRRTPGFTLVIIVTLAIGVGANVSLYALVDTLMFSAPSGVRELDRLVSFRSVDNYVQFLTLSEQARTLQAAVYTKHQLSLGTGVDAEPVHVECVSASYLPVLGAPPALGRTFTDDTGVDAREPAVILSHRLWQRHFSASPAAVGQRLALGDRTFTVIGVMPRGFTGVEQEAVDAWMLLSVSPELCSFTGRTILAESSASWLDTIGRLAPGVTIEQAGAEVLALESPEQQFRRAQAPPNDARSELTPLHESRRQRVAKDAGLSLWLLGGSAIVLLIACSNVAGLLSIRAVDRRRETSVRLQLGASRGRILRQFFLEQLVIAIACGAMALSVSAGLNHVLATFFPYAVISEDMGAQIFGIAAVLALTAAVLSGIVPALQVSKIKATGSSQASVFVVRDRSRFRSTLLVAQVALAFTLVVGGGLFVQSVLQTQQNLGYNPDGLYLIEIDLRKAGYRSATDLRRAYDAMAERLRSVPGVEHVAMSSGAFLDVGGAFKVRRHPAAGNEPDAVLATVSPTVFDALGTRLIRGRLFTARDDAGAPKVAVVDAGFARGQWPGEDAIGQCTFPDDPRETCARIVGIVESRRAHLGSPRMESTVFTPMAQAVDDEDAPQFMAVRAASTRSMPAAIAAAARAALPQSPFVNVRSLDSVASEQTRSWRLGRLLFGLFAGVGVFLSALGLYSVLALAARQRTTEIGVRMALGARPLDIARLVLRHAAAFVGLGWIAGLAIALAGARFIERLLYQVSSTDPGTFTGASVVVLLAGMAGCALPAWRAARLSPVKALRHE